MDDITVLLRRAEGGEAEASARLYESVYDELRAIARRQLRRAHSSETLRTTALVHEAYLKLSSGGSWSVADRSHFYALTAQAMRRILVDHARERLTAKRGGGVLAMTVEADEVAAPERAAELLALDRALDALERADPELARLVEQRYFAGLTIEEVAELLEVSERTAKRRWQAARAFLLREIDASPA